MQVPRIPCTGTGQSILFVLVSFPRRRLPAWPQDGWLLFSLFLPSLDEALAFRAYQIKPVSGKFY